MMPPRGTSWWHSIAPCPRPAGPPPSSRRKSAFSTIPRLPTPTTGPRSPSSAPAEREFFTTKTPRTPRATISKQSYGRRELENFRVAFSYGPLGTQNHGRSLDALVLPLRDWWWNVWVEVGQPVGYTSEGLNSDSEGRQGEGQGDLTKE